MKRRNFIKNISRLSATPFLLNGLAISPFASPRMLPLLNCQGIDQRILVIVFLKGGNDGINTLVPLDQYGTYSNLRPDLSLSNTGPNALMNLDSSMAVEDQIGLHPAMTGFKAMYENDQARIIQGVGYPLSNQSHFKSTDLWLSGGDGTPANFNIPSGWIGRYLESTFPSIAGNPISEFPDPLGIQLGDSKPSLSLYNYDLRYIGTNLSGQNPGNLFGLLNGLGTAPHNEILDSEYGDEIQYMMEVENSTNAYGQRITDVYNAGTNSNTTYPNFSLAGQLKTVARMIAGGSTTKIYLVHKGGFDIHSNQVEANNRHLGTHAKLLQGVFDSIKAFHEDLTQLGLESRVMTSTFSEFGRRVTQNGSLGTDHGTLGPMFLFGSAVNSGVSGTNVDLGNITDSGNLIENLQSDYRGVFKTLLQDWLGADEVVLSEAQFDAFSKVPDLVNPNAVVDPSCYIGPQTPLPIVLAEFQAEVLDSEEVLLYWKTSSEINNDYFEVERSMDGAAFSFVGKVFSKGQSNSLQAYELLDEKPFLGTSYYRLKSVALDGSDTYSEVRVVKIESQVISNFKVYPNPAIYEANVVLTSKINLSAGLEIWAFNGSRVGHRAIEIQEGFNKIRVDVNHLKTGQYLLKVVSETLNLAPLKLMVNT